MVASEFHPLYSKTADINQQSKIRTEEGKKHIRVVFPLPAVVIEPSCLLEYVLHMMTKHDQCYGIKHKAFLVALFQIKELTFMVHISIQTNIYIIRIGDYFIYDTIHFSYCISHDM